MPDQRDIVLVPVPFTDMSSSRRRPVIVVSNAAYHQATQDMIIVAMTSNPTVTPFSFILTQDDLESGQLNRPGRVRADKIYALAQSLVVKTFGKVQPAILAKIRKMLIDVTQP
ncbi:MAG: type II toxin-antitoxin system PemK/MazF family toxin [Gemmataceae bacterium]|nr:type II toxin-antitoxin system PemK/MazF family toxin [Gemmataceae bacterium]